MKAGRELDARIAEEVMEWDVYRKGEVVYCEAPILLRSSVKDGFAAEDIWRCGNNRYSPFSLPHYSTQIADAWLVVEKLNNDGYVVEIVNDCVAWNVSFTHVDDGKKHVADWKNSLETQICLAALKAVKVT